jgi:ATP-binding cassette, subfamily C, bacterial
MFSQKGSTLFKIITFPNFIAYLFRWYGRSIILLVSTLTVAAMLGGLSIALIIPLLEIVINNSQDFVPNNNIAIIIEQIFLFIGLNLNVVNIMIVFIALLTLQTLLTQFNSYFIAKLHISFSKNLSKRLVDGYLNAELSYFYNIKVGTLVNNLTLECDRASNTLTLFSYMTRELVLGVVYIIIPFIISWKISAFVIALGFSLTLLIRNLHVKAETFGESLTRSNIDVQNEVSEKLSAIKDIKSGVSESRVQQRIMKSISIKLYYRYKSLINNALVVNIQTLTEGIIIASVIIFAMNYAKIEFQNFVVLVLSMQRFTPTIRMANRWYNEIKVTLPSLKLIEHSLDELNSAEEHNGVGREKLNFINDDINLKNISYKYKTEDRNFSLTNITLQIVNNKITAILGKSGSGKSTIVDMLLGFNIPDSGEIFIGNKSFNNFTIKSIRKHIGYIPQDGVLFNDSIKNNIIWYKPDASEQEISYSARIANIDNFISNLPNGYETVIGDRGLMLSGGQKQRIILARNIILKPSVLILDEATSNLDLESETKILRSIKLLSKQMSIVMITHRRETTKIADFIYWVENGTIIKTINNKNTIKSEKIP